jgi:ATP-binding cassette subfamily B protein
VILRLLGKAQEESYRLTIKKNRISIGASVCLYVAMTAGYYAVLGWGAWRIFNGAITFGTLTAILGLTADISTPFQQLSSLFPQYLSFCASAERLDEIESLPEEVKGEQKDPENLHAKMTAITVRDLSFSYGDAPVLYRANAVFEKGKITAVCGKSGAGKSTLLNLMLGLLTPDSGETVAVMEDGTECSLSCYRKLFAYVPQDFLLLSGTVLENITLFDEDPDMNRVSEVLKLACLTDEVEKLRDGINTQLGEGGSRLSGGQRQRMAIARALYSPADVLLMDESTAAFSVDSEEMILKNLRATGKTVIFVTHRQTAVNLCDFVWRVESASLKREL